jgi:uncharacterized membrane protein
MPDDPNSTSHVSHVRARSGRLTCTAAIVLLLGACPALADLQLCNSTSGRIGVALGYQDGTGWTTEGWWTIAGGACETLLKGRLPSRFYYVHAVDYDRGGEWSGPTTMCIDDKSFTIRGNADCEARGHRRGGFMEVDTNDARAWTIRLGDQPSTGTAQR